MHILKVIFIIVFVQGLATAQPSGGPYGPLSQTYSVPDNVNNIYYVAPDGKEKNTGKTLQQ